MKYELSFREAMTIVMDELTRRGVLPSNTTIDVTTRMVGPRGDRSLAFSFEAVTESAP